MPKANYDTALELLNNNQQYIFIPGFGYATANPYPFDRVTIQMNTPLKVLIWNVNGILKTRYGNNSAVRN